MSGPSTELTPVIAASTHWLARAYPAVGAGSVAHTRAELPAFPDRETAFSPENAETEHDLLSTWSWS